jgi:steroid 5-alpha reductase family enzyme
LNDLLPLILIGGTVLLIVFTLAWLRQLRTGNAAIVEPVWSASFAVLAAIYFVLIDGYPPRQLLVLGVVCIWVVRLGSHLYHRTVGQPEDARYAALRKEWGNRQAALMLALYYFHAGLALILSIPFVLMMMNTTRSLNPYEIAGVVLWAIALTGETIADQQLKKFKEVQANKDKIFDKGLWRYSRHPNYFFEWLIWVAYFIMSLGSAWGYVSIICPVMMYYFLTRVTGIKYTEGQMRTSKGKALEEYQRTTSAFFILPKKAGTKD